ncbi:MAG: hypothetical protein A7316_10905 [Candidatus Altiarchaeales archaeon WOR_SM1_86-2]|nr:MAG: hypothetical protein A7316_10905 [Candidatus Altiarchaeales archaeon WOR_SM1_86-2]
MFNIYLSSHAKRFLRKSQRKVYGRIMKKIKDLSIDPFPSDAKRVAGRKEKVFRVRVGDYRIQYVVFYDRNEILITEIDKREGAY